MCRTVARVVGARRSDNGVYLSQLPSKSGSGTSSTLTVPITGVGTTGSAIASELLNSSKPGLPAGTLPDHLQPPCVGAYHPVHASSSARRGAPAVRPLARDDR